MKITKKEYEKAVKVLLDYANEVPKNNIKTTSDIGARVKLSQFGKEMQGNSKKIGTVVNFNQWLHFLNDGISTVVWDGQSKSSDMHISQIELL